MYLFLDLILLLNFFIDLLLLWLTAIIRKLEIHKGRLVCAACFGSLYVLCLFIPSLQSYYSPLFKIACSLIMVWIAFGFSHVQKFFSTFLMFYFVSFVTGGGMLAVHYLLQDQYLLQQGVFITNSNGFGDPVAWWFVLLGFPFMYLFTKARWWQVERSRAQMKQKVSLSIVLKGQQISCIGLVDTGNQLYEPLSQTPVMVVEASLFQAILPDGLFQALCYQGDVFWEMERLEELLSENQEWLANIRLIPYRGIQQQMKLMLAIKPEEIEIKDSKHIYATKQVYLGFNQQALSATGDYQAIVHPQLLEAQHIRDHSETGRDVEHVHEI